MDKPVEIIELEKYYKIILSPYNPIHDLCDSKNKNSYKLNENKNIIGLNLYDNEISDISILESYTDLSLLNLMRNSIENFTSLKNLTLLTKLDLGYNNISDISFIQTLTSLKELKLEGNKITDLSKIITLSELTLLYLWQNEISNISPLVHLTKLKFLRLWNNQISDISALGNLTQLLSLDLDKNLVTDISVLKKLENLHNLYLTDNNIINLTALKHLTKLSTLTLCRNKITDISLLVLLKNLTSLDLSNNNILDFSVLKNLPSLDRLSINDSNISDITFLKNIKSLIYLSLRNNQILDIAVLKNLTNLTFLNLEKNQITDIRPLTNLIQNGVPINDNLNFNRGLIIKENPLEFPPLETLKDGNEAIIRFFEKIYREGTDTIFEAKVTLVGEGSAGKTSLLKRLINARQKLPEERNRTRGISIVDWEFKKQKNKRHIAHIWDFGGQDVYYPVHRFFLTENSVFVLLASSRQNTHHFDYWIPTIYQFGGKSPIILGQTCHDGNSIPWNDVGAYIANENFNIIKDQEQNYHEINLPNKNKGLIQIKKSIINQILNLPHYKKSVPKSWIPIRELINNLQKKNCITYLELKEKIKLSNPQSFSSKEDIEDCLRFFHSIGIILWYHKEAKLKNWVILNPKWSVDAVYKIIDDDKVSNQKGIIFSFDFERVWDETIYEDRHDILKDMLEVFKIAFPKKHNKSDYIMPTRLQSIPSENIWLDSASCLRIEYQYEFMPKGLVNQISAELSRYIIDDDQVWNNGVNFCDEETTCQVFEDFYHRKITIKAKGKDARSIIMIVMNAIKDITDGYKGVIPKIIIPCVCAKCLTKSDATTFSYKMLLEKVKEKAESKVFCNISEEVFKVEELLFNIGLPNPVKVVRDDLIKMEKMKEEQNEPIKVFVTYSWSDENGHFDEATQNKTGAFVNQLRTKWNMEASFDLYKEENNFVKMMYENLNDCDKIIIILTKGYAVKADKFKGGVGTEYERIINDINKNPKKYILVSFEKRSDSIYPYGFQGSDVIIIDGELNGDNLSDSENRLLSKLTDEPLVEIPDLSGKTPRVTKKAF